MALVVKPKTDGMGKIIDKVSAYNPSKQVKERLAMMSKDFSVGETIMNQQYEEFGRKVGTGPTNNAIMTLVERNNENQRRFNNYIPPKSLDPDLSWHAQTIRPITRNKIISIVAHITANILYPNIIAQNDSDQEDKEFSMVMRDTVEWVCQQMKYEDTFINAVQDMCVSPALIMYVDYAEVKKQIKDIQEDGTWKWKEIVNTLYSGFFSSIVPVDELYIGNIYEPNIQRQPFIIRRKMISYEAAQQKYGHLSEFKKYVQPGLRTFFSTSDNSFYEQYDEELQDRLVEEVTYYNYAEDLELRTIGGILVDDPDRPLQRKSKEEGLPYPFVKGFYESYNSKFFYGMALAQKLSPDQDVVDTLYNMIIDGTYLQLMPPINVYGVSEMEEANFNPSGVNTFADPNTKVEPMQIGNNLSAGLNVLQKVEGSLSESSQDPRGAGLAGGGSETKYEVQRLEQNAKTVLGRTGKMVASVVRDFGELLVLLIVQHIPIATISEVAGDESRLKFPTLFLPDREEDGKKVSRQIDFTNELPEASSEEELKQIQEDESFNIAEQELDTGMSLVKVRPDTFRRMKYLTRVEPDFIDKATKFSKRLMLYDRGIQNPIINQETLLKETLLKELSPGEEDKFINKQPAMPVPQKGLAPMPTAAIEEV